ncbi:hypothetical protein EXIGLDRAFT_730501, partial [Exidia glandulosa HHB12029]
GRERADARSDEGRRAMGVPRLYRALSGSTSARACTWQASTRRADGQGQGRADASGDEERRGTAGRALSRSITLYAGDERATCRPGASAWGS